METIMRKFLTSILILILLSGFSSPDSTLKRTHKKHFTKGERLEYKVHYGLVNAGEAVMEIEENLYRINNKPCFKIDVYGKTVGIFDFVHKVRDNWGAYIDTSTLVPQKSYVYLEEGKYRKYEVVTFNHPKKIASVGKFDKNNKKEVERSDYPVPQDVMDLIGGCYFLRTLDYDSYQIGETLAIPAFFGDKIYDFKVKITGKESLKTKLGEFPAIVLSPVIPENKLFDGENPVTIWVSDDKDRIPLKIQAKLWVGSIDIDLKNIEKK
jgi:hypothetical protein